MTEGKFKKLVRKTAKQGLDPYYTVTPRMSKAGVLYTHLVRADDSPTVQPVKLRKSHRCRRKYASAKVQGGISHNPTSKVRTTVQLRKQATNN